MKWKNAFWGVFFILAGVLVIASQLGVFAGISVWTMLATVLLAAVIVKSIPRLNWAGILLPISIGYLLYQKPLTLVPLPWWALIGGAILASIGLSLIFHRKPKHHGDFISGHSGGSYSNAGIAPDMEHEQNDDDNHPYAKVKFGAASKYVHGSCMETGHFESRFGALEVYLDQATLAPGGADVYVDCSFGAIEFYVPRTWRVKESIATTIGGVENRQRHAVMDPNAPELRLTGNLSLGGVEIKYV